MQRRAQSFKVNSKLLSNFCAQTSEFRTDIEELELRAPELVKSFLEVGS
jgi:hypothetical protein